MINVAIELAIILTLLTYLCYRPFKSPVDRKIQHRFFLAGFLLAFFFAVFLSFRIKPGDELEYVGFSLMRIGIAFLPSYLIYRLTLLMSKKVAYYVPFLALVPILWLFTTSLIVGYGSISKGSNCTYWTEWHKFVGIKRNCETVKD